MKRFLKIFVPILLALCIIAGSIWYLFFYDRGLTQDILLSGARFFRDQGYPALSSWFYDRAYDQGIDKDAIAIETAQQYITAGNYTQAEVTLTKAIQNGGGIDVYIALSDTFVRQDKLLDAAALLDKVANPSLKLALDELRPKTPSASHDTEQTYHELITVSIKADNSLYVSTDGEFPSKEADAYTGSITLKEGFTGIQAIAIAENGLVSPLASFGYTVIGVIEEVTIQDSAMEQAIRTGLGFHQEQKLLTSDLWKITKFSIPQEARNYSALSYMLYLEELTVESGASGQIHNLKNVKGMKSLTIINTPLSSEDLETIGILYSLESLTMDGCSLATSAPLSDLVSLKYLNLNNNAIGNISAIASMPELTELYLQRNALRDLSALAGCKELTRLDISYNSITTVSALLSLTKLTHLNISYNQISDISTLSACSMLKELKANYNQIADLSALSHMESLEYLDVSNNALTNIDALGSVRSITYLNFSYNQVTQLPQWSKSSSLITIDGSHNQLSDLSALSGLLRLNNILMDYNAEIKSVAELANCPVLIQVNVYGTKVSDVSMLTEQSIIVNYNPTEGL